MHLKTRNLLIVVGHIFCSVTVFAANLEHNLLVDKDAVVLEKEKVASSLQAIETTLEEATVDKKALPLVKVAHSNVMDLLHLFFVSKTVPLSSYTPLVQNLGIRINWFKWLQNIWDTQQKSYGGGIDLHSAGPIQLSLDIAYRSYQPKDIVDNNDIKYKSSGMYGLGALLYVIHPNPRTNAYLGMGYGHSRFDLMILDDDHNPSKPLVAGWIKVIAGSELRLVAQLYGGMQFGIAHLLHRKENDDPRVSNYYIPGYGKIVNKIMPDVTLYLKWNISFLEKRIDI